MTKVEVSYRYNEKDRVFFIDHGVILESFITRVVVYIKPKGKCSVNYMIYKGGNPIIRSESALSKSKKTAQKRLAKLKEQQRSSLGIN